MSKYNNLKFLKWTEACVEHQCNRCGQIISIGEFYYAEKIKDKFLHAPYMKKFCVTCYQKFGDDLLGR